MAAAAHITPGRLVAPGAAARPTPGNTPGRQIGSGPAGAVKAAIVKATSAPKTSSTSASAPAARVSAQRYSGAYSGALNNISDQAQRVRDVATRRQADNQAYTAYIMGQQGKIAAAAHAADQQNVANNVAVQGATLGSQLKLQQQLQSQRDVQGGAGVGGVPGSPNYNAGRSGAGSGLGVGPGAGAQVVSTAGPIPQQQLQGLVSDQQLTQALLGAGSARQAATANTNAGKAGFLQAAAQAGALANSRAIAGDAFDQQSKLGAQKTDLLTHRTDSVMADKRAAASAAAGAANAQLAHEDRVASRNQSANQALLSHADRAAALANQALQGRANRRVRLKTAASSKNGGLTYAQSLAASTKADKADTTLRGAAADAAFAVAHGVVKIRDGKGAPTGKTRKPSRGEVVSELRNKYKDEDVAKAAIDMATLGHLSQAAIQRLKARGIAVPSGWIKASGIDAASLKTTDGDSSNVSGLSTTRP